MTYTRNFSYEGKEEEFEFKDSLNFGEVESLLEKCTKEEKCTS